MKRLTLAEREAVWDPYYTGEIDTNAIVRQLKSEGYTFRCELLYSTAKATGGIRVGLFDSAGCVEERFYTREGRGDIKRAIRNLIDINGHAPALWATEAI